MEGPPKRLTCMPCPSHLLYSRFNLLLAESGQKPRRTVCLYFQAMGTSIIGMLICCECFDSFPNGVAGLPLASGLQKSGWDAIRVLARTWSFVLLLRIFASSDLSPPPSPPPAPAPAPPPAPPPPTILKVLHHLPSDISRRSCVSRSTLGSRAPVAELKTILRIWKIGDQTAK